jgi:cytosine/creatinine deaminase
MSASDPGFVAALEEAKSGFAEGGVPIGACLVSQDGRILGRGHNMRVQKGSAILHAEISALDNSGRLAASAYAGATMYTTLSPCDMCTGSCILYKIKRVVIGENANFVGGEDYLKQKGIEVVVLDNDECKDLMARFIAQNPAVWCVNSIRIPAAMLTFVQERRHRRAVAAATIIIA